MSVSVERLEHNLAKLTVEIPVEDIEKAIDKVYQKQKNRIQLPGFRKGKAPRKMIEKMYGKEVFLEDAVNECVPEAYEAACKESELVIMSRPEIEYQDVKAGEPVVFMATVATRPEVTLGEYKGLEVEDEDVTVTDEEVEAKLKEEQEKNSTTAPVEGRPVQDGDIVELNFEGFVDGQAFPGGKGENFPLTIGSHSFIDTFEDQLIGAEIGEEREVNVTFPEDYNAKELAGKPAVFQTKILSIKVKELPALDDEFASEVSEFETLAEYRADVRKTLEEKKAEQAKTAKEDKLIAKAVENASMDIPELMLTSQAENMIQEFSQRLSYQGMSMEQYLQYTGSTTEKMLEQNKESAKIRIQSRLVLEEIAKAENLEATEEDFEKEIANMASQYGMEPEQVKEYMDDAQREEMKANILVQKAVDLLYETAK